MTGSLVVERSGARTSLTLNRPERLNALDAELVEALISAIGAAAHDGTRLLVVRGAGRAFSAGFDFGGLDAHSEGDLVLRFIRLEQLLQALWRAPFVTAAAVHGACFGAAADLVAACNVRIGAADARFRMPGLRFGIALGTGRLARVIGTDGARNVLTTSRVFDAAEASRIGFLSTVAEADDWAALIDQATADASVLSAPALTRMLDLTRESDGKDDAAAMAALVATLAQPGLKQRIADYLASLERRS